MMPESTRKSTIESTNKGTDTNKAIESRHEVMYKADRKETIIINSTKYTVLLSYLSQPLMKGNCVITMTQYN